MFQTTNQNPIDHWLVVYLPPWKMIEFVSWGDDIPNWMESHKIPWFQTTNQDHVGKTAPCLPSPNFTVFIGMEITFPVSGKNGIGFPLLHTDAFTHSPFHTQTLLHTITFTRRNVYTQTLVCRDTSTHKRFYTLTFLQTRLHANAFSHKLVHTQTLWYTILLHTNTFTHRRFYTQTILHTDPFTHKLLYTQSLLHTRMFTHKRLCTETLLDTIAFTHQCF